MTSASLPSSCSPAIISILLTLYFHYDNADTWGEFIFHMGAKFYSFCDAINLLPQLMLLQRLGEVENLTKHYVFVMALGHTIQLILYAMTSVETWQAGDHGDFISSVFAQLISVMLMADFFYYYFLSLQTGTMILPSRKLSL